MILCKVIISIEIFNMANLCVCACLSGMWEIGLHNLVETVLCYACELHINNFIERAYLGGGGQGGLPPPCSTLDTPLAEKGVFKIVYG